MYLSRLAVLNYRSCRHIVVNLQPNQPNVFIGINDCGKTTIMKAGKLLFDDKPVFKSLSDASGLSDISNTPLDNEELEIAIKDLGLPKYEYNGQEAIIIGKLILEPGDSEEAFQPYSEQLRLSREFSLDGSIDIMRCFSSTGACKTFLLCYEHDDRQEPLWSLKEDKLIQLNGQLGVTDIQNINGIGKPSKYERIKAVHSVGTPIIKWREYKLEKKDKEAFPDFKYLDWGCSLDDIRSIATDYLTGNLTSAFDDAMKVVKDQAKVLEDALNESLSSNLVQELTKVVPSLIGLVAKLVTPEIKPTVKEILVEKNTSEGLIHIDSQGEGVKRQIWFGLLKAQAKRLGGVSTGKQYIWAFDEPETHLYPGAQREFFDLLCNATSGGVQVLLSTHSTIFVDKTRLNELTKVRLDNSYSVVNTCTSAEDVFTALKLKNSDFLFHDKFLVVEGATELALFPHLYQIFCGKTLVQDNIQIVSLNGGGGWKNNRKLFADIMTGFKKDLSSVVYVFDNDQRDKVGVELEGSKFFLGKQDMEDSIDSNTWVTVINELFAEEGLSDIAISIQVIEEIKETITVESTEKKDKFVSKLTDKVKELQNGNIRFHLSSKPDLADRLCRHLIDLNQICPELRKAFLKLNPEVEEEANAAVTELLNETGVEIQDVVEENK